ncbi:HAD family phosphatase [Candidatus Woesearchaeota archaeon]|nr:HAD family phosphatase [Candidatus Woesearchaeota archaeon]
MQPVIISDIGGVLLSVDKKPMSARLAKYSELSFEEIASHFSQARLTGIDTQFGRGLVTPEEFYRSICSGLRLSGLSFEEFSGIYHDIFARKEDSIALLRQLSQKYVITLLSNTDSLHYGSLSKLLGEDMHLFKEVVLSFQVHSVKPEPAIYLEASRRLGVKPEQCIYIDDVEEYARAASKVGMKGIAFTSALQLKSELDKLGVR